MKTFYLVFFIISIPIVSFNQNLPKLEKKYLEKSQSSGLFGKNVHNKYLFQNNLNSHYLKKPQLNNSNIDVNIIEQKLDSFRIVGNDGTVAEKNLFKYDSYGNCIERIWFIDTANYEKYCITYDEFGYLIEDSKYKWNDSIGTWINYSFIEYTYSNNLLIESVSGRLVDEEIDYNYKTEYSYNVNGNLIEERNFKFTEIYPGISNWKYMRVDSFQYNGFNKIKQYISYKIDPDFQASAKVTYNYDETGNLTKENSYHWNEGHNLWENTSEREFVYDKAGNLIETTFFYWVSEQQKFTGTSKWEFTYDDNNNMLSLKNIYFNRDDEKWEPGKFLCSYEYSEKGNVLEYKNYEWDKGKDDFSLTENISFEYDESKSNDVIALPEDFNKPLFNLVYSSHEYVGFSYGYFRCNHKLVKGVFKYPDKGNLVDVGEWQFHYSSFESTGISETLNSDFSIFPNPATESITLDWLHNSEVLDLNIFNLQGQLILNKIVTKNNPVNIKSLNKGMYFYRLSDKVEAVYSGKLIVK